LKHLIKGIFRILRKTEKTKVFRLIIFDLLITVLDVGFLAALLLIINFYTQRNTINTPVILPDVFADKNSLSLIGVFLLLFAIKNTFGFLAQKAQHHYFYGVASRLSKKNILHYLRGDYGAFVNINSAIHTRRISNQPIEFSHYILNNFQQVVSQSAMVLFMVMGILLYHPALFLILFGLLLPPMLMLNWFIKKKLKALRTQIKVINQKVIQHLNESLAGYVESNMYGKHDFFSGRYFNYQQQLNETIAEQQTWQSLPARSMEVFAVAGFFILIAVNKWAGNATGISVLTIGIFMAAAYKLIPGLVKIMNSAGQIKTYEFVLNDLLHNRTDAVISRAPANSPIGSVKFDGVTFSYKTQPVVNNLSFELLPGDLMGISADSGKGKTTIINLLLGFLKESTGTISINNKALSAVERQQYRNHISLIKQQPFFIHDTILKNITLADDEPDRQRLQYVFNFCGLTPLLNKYPEGINKTISENGRNLSGGQRQRIILARALYHNFDLLILDEPFSEMDTDAETELLTQLQQLAQQGKMIILITHNKASLAFCSKVILLSEQYV